MKNPDSFLNLSAAVIEVLQNYGSAEPEEIKKYLQQSGWGNPPLNSINKVLTQFLVGQAKLNEDGRWILIRQNPFPIKIVANNHPDKKDKIKHEKPHLLSTALAMAWAASCGVHQ